MILLERPYVSDFLLQTVKEHQIPLISLANTRNMFPEPDLPWISEEIARDKIMASPHPSLMSNSENSLAWLEQNLVGHPLLDQIAQFKDKVLFRELLKEAYPDFYFRGLDLVTLEALDPKALPFPLILKPAVGFYSVGVLKIDRAEDWQGGIAQLKNQMQSYRMIFPEAVLGQQRFILEAVIPGKEYAIDCYYDDQGNPVILNILYHLFSSDQDVSDRVYMTSPKIFRAHYSSIHQFLVSLGEKTGLRNFPLHLEVRISSSDQLIPIEVNPLRFGGFCTTGDQSFYAYGFNSYLAYLQNFKPNWEQIFAQKEEALYSIIVLDNNSGIPFSDIEAFDYALLADSFEAPLVIRPVNFQVHPVFGFVFTRTRPDNVSELEKILKSDLRPYIRLKS